MDRRQRKTREAIFKAFTDLLGSKKYHRITVQEIIDRANIGRSTFYAHFETKDELLRTFCVDIFDHVFAPELQSEVTHDFSRETGVPQAMVTHILYHLRDNKERIEGILASESSDLFLDYFRTSLTKLVRNYLHASELATELGLPEGFLINHEVSAFIGMVQWWFRDGLGESPEDLAQYFMTLTDYSDADNHSPKRRPPQRTV